MPAFFWAYKKSLAAFIIIFCLFPREKADCQPFPLLKRGSRLIAGIRRHQQRYEKRGFKFFGTTICYAFLQATGFVDDHLADCICRKTY